MKKPIHKINFWHGLLQAYVNIYIYTFYKRVTVVGKNNIPKNKPLLFVINHQNALMDALTARTIMKGQHVFMARADIFQSPVVAKILRFLKILPIYRIRDGIKNLQNNDAVFEEAVDILVNKRRLAILPEGNHFGQKRLRVLKKGMARIAFQAEERHNFELDIQIVPIGLDYSHYIKFGKDLMVKFGEPLALSKFKDIYLENNQKGMNALMQEVRERMLPNMLSINDADNYDEIATTKDLYINHLLASKQMPDNHLTIVEASQKIADQLIELKTTNEGKFTAIGKMALAVKEGVEMANLRYWNLNKTKYSVLGNMLSVLLQIVFLPFFIAGFVPNIGPFYLPVYLSKNIKDPQFLSSIRFGSSVLTFTLFYLIYLILLLIFVKPYFLALSIFIAFPFFGYFSFTYYKWVKKTMAKSRLNKLVRSKNEQWSEVVKTNADLISELNSLIK